MAACTAWMPCMSDTPPPRANTDTATTSVQKYSSLPKPKGCSMVAGFLAWCMPKSTRKPLPESTMEWMPSEIMADEPEMAAAMNLTMPTAMFEAMAA